MEPQLTGNYIERSSRNLLRFSLSYLLAFSLLAAACSTDDDRQNSAPNTTYYHSPPSMLDQPNNPLSIEATAIARSPENAPSFTLYMPGHQEYENIAQTEIEPILNYANENMGRYLLNHMKHSGLINDYDDAIDYHMFGLATNGNFNIIIPDTKNIDWEFKSQLLSLTFKQLEEMLSQVQAAGYSIDRKPTVFLFEREDGKFGQAILYTNSGCNQPFAFVAGMSNDIEMAGITMHETAHIMMSGTPTWLQEGLARLIELKLGETALTNFDLSRYYYSNSNANLLSFFSHTLQGYTAGPFALYIDNQTKENGLLKANAQILMNMEKSPDTGCYDDYQNYYNDLEAYIINASGRNLAKLLHEFTLKNLNVDPDTIPGIKINTKFLPIADIALKSDIKFTTSDLKINSPVDDTTDNADDEPIGWDPLSTVIIDIQGIDHTDKTIVIKTTSEISDIYANLAVIETDAEGNAIKLLQIIHPEDQRYNDGQASYAFNISGLNLAGSNKLVLVQTVGVDASNFSDINDSMRPILVPRFSPFEISLSVN